MLALIRSFIATRSEDRPLSCEDIAAFSERTGIPIAMGKDTAQLAAKTACENTAAQRLDA